MFSERKGAQKRFVDKDLEEILDEYSCLSETQSAEVLNVTQECILRQLHQTGIVQKKGNWLLHDLTERAIERRKTMCQILLKRYKG